MRESKTFAGKFVILTGASGAGKTTLANRIRDLAPNYYQVIFFDSVGVPSLEDMQEECGSAEQWQRATTFAWIERIKPLLLPGHSVLFEGQTRLSFIQEALTAHAIADAQIVLIDCDDATRTARLSQDRGQPELANAEMMNWAHYLRQEAIAARIEILDTAVTPFPACINHLVKLLT